MDVQLAATFQSKPGAMLAANYAVPNEQVAATLGRNLSGDAPNVTVNLVAPGAMRGDRINEIDIRIAKLLKFGRSRRDAGGRSLQRAELERGADLQHRVRSRHDVAAAVDDPDAAVSSNHRRDRLLTSMLTSRRHRPARRLAADRGRLSARSLQSRLRRTRIVRSRCSSCTATRRDAQIAVVGDRVLEPLLGKGLPGGVDYYSEGLDQARFAHADYQTAFRDSLRLKYEQQRFDLVIPVGDIPVDFVEKNRDDLFPDAAVVFFANRPPGRRLPNSTGLIVPLNLTGTIDSGGEAPSEPPAHLRHFECWRSGTRRSRARSFVRSDPRFAITFLSGLPTRALEARLASLPENSIVYYLNVDRDGADQHLPSVGLPGSHRGGVQRARLQLGGLDTGSRGGRRQSEGSGSPDEDDRRARAAGASRRARRLHPGSSPDLNVNQVDWRQLRRWGISEALCLPERSSDFGSSRCGIAIRSTSWSRPRPRCADDSIAGLLAQRAARRQAEDEARGSQAALRRSYDRLRDLGARLLNAQETERSRIARELHDDISQQMALLEMDLELLADAVDGRAVDLAGDVLHRRERHCQERA